MKKLQARETHIGDRLLPENYQVNIRPTDS
jgi:hypothetical protein